eukprot:gene24687-32156_t
MSFEVFREPLYRRYYAPVFSGAFCYAIVFSISLILVPLFIAYNTSVFWTKELTVYEQPRVLYKYFAIVQMYGLDSSSDGDVPLYLYYSTSQAVSSLYSENLRVPIVHTIVQDDNRDGLPDRFEFSVAMPLSPQESVKRVVILLYFDVTFSMKAKINFDAISFLDHDSSLPIANLHADGDLLLRQTIPLSSKGGYYKPYVDSLVPSTIGGTSAADVSVESILRSSSCRNGLTFPFPSFSLYLLIVSMTLTSVSMILRPTYIYAMPQSEPVLSSADLSILSPRKDLPRIVNASLSVRVPEQPLRYVPTASVILTNAWVIYCSFFIFFAFVLYRTSSFLFRHQILTAYHAPDIVVKQD